MRSILSLTGLLLALAIAAWVGQKLLSTPALSPPSPVGTPTLTRTPADAQATIDQARRDLDEAARQAAQRSAEADK